MMWVSVRERVNEIPAAPCLILIVSHVCTLNIQPLTRNCSTATAAGHVVGVVDLVIVVGVVSIENRIRPNFKIFAMVVPGVGGMRFIAGVGEVSFCLLKFLKVPLSSGRNALLGICSVRRLLALLSSSTCPPVPLTNFYTSK